MADDNQDMEDILSSIKDILEEDEKNQETNNILGETLASNVEDDVLELSPDMRISDDSLADVSLPENVEVPTDEISTDEDSTAFNRLLEEPITEAEEKTEFSDSVSVEDTVQTEETSDAPVSSDSQISDIISEWSQEEASPEIEDISEPEKEETNPVLEENEPTDSIDETSFSSEIEETSTPIETDFSQETVVISNEEQINDEAPLETPSTETENTQDAVDVSAGIISNFAKLFSHTEKQNEPEQVDHLEQISVVGDSSKTLEQFVLDAVVKVVGSEIKSKWNDGADFQSFAMTEIEKQTKDWVEKNLPSVVEKIVKQEIERVVAKVNS